jgi:CubicO group peptidase (beta-lactamase class C family)
MKGVDEALCAYLPTFQPLACPHIAKTATVRDFLYHLTGLPDPYPLYTGFEGRFRYRNNESLMNLVNNLDASDENLRTTWTYNSLTYSLLGMLIEKLSATSFADFIRERILLPLNMRNSLVIRREDEICPIGKKLAKPYIIQEGDQVRELPFMTFGDTPLAASFGMASSVSDLLIYSMAVIRASKLDLDAPRISSEQEVLAAIRMIIEPGVPIRNVDDGVTSYRAGWFHTTGRSISFDIFYDPLIGSASEMDPKPAEERHSKASGTNDEGKDPFEPGSNSIFYGNGYIKGFTSNLHIYPNLGHAVVVLGNSTGRSEPCGYASWLMTALVCGGRAPADLIPVLQEEVGEFANRWKTLAQVLNFAEGQQHPTNQSDIKFVGRYQNTEFGMEILIQNLRTGSQSTADSSLVDAEPLLFSFGDQAEIQLPLWKHKDEVLCFFPSKEEFERKIMPPFSSASQYLLHMHLEAENEAAIGLWWQYDGGSDALWFGRDVPRNLVAFNRRK